MSTVKIGTSVPTEQSEAVEAARRKKENSGALSMRGMCGLMAKQQTTGVEAGRRALDRLPDSGGVPSGGAGFPERVGQGPVEATIRRSKSPMVTNNVLILALAMITTPHLALTTDAASPIGAEFQVNSYTSAHQSEAAAAMESDGDFVIVWGDGRQDGSNGGVFGQRYASDGSRSGQEFGVNSYTTKTQGRPSVSLSGNGNFVVAWESYDQDGEYWGIFGQRYASNGSPLGGEFQVSSYTTEYQRNPAVGVDVDGDFLVAWQSDRQDGYLEGIFGQLYASDGSERGGEFQVSTYTTYFQGYPGVAVASDGDFVVAWWSDRQDGDGTGIFGQRYDSDGSQLGSEFAVNTYTTGNQYGLGIAADPNGDFVVVWNSGPRSCSFGGQDGNCMGVFGQRYASDGSTRGAEFAINTYTTFNQEQPDVSVADNGDFVVAWHSWGQDGEFYSVMGQCFDSGGSPRAGEFLVNSFSTSEQEQPAVAMDFVGNFVVVWASMGQDGNGYGVFGQLYDDAVHIFSDGFEVGDATAWSSTVGGP